MKNTLDAIFKQNIAAGAVPGAIAAITRADGLLYAGGFGEAELGQGNKMGLDTVVWLASMTKPIVGAAIMVLVDQGKLHPDLNEPVARWLPQLGQVKVLTGWDDAGQPVLREPKGFITARQLLTHTCGFANDIWSADIARYHQVTGKPRAGSGKKAGLDVPLTFDPGTQWDYGIGIDWAGQLVEAISGMSLGAFIKQHITDPLGMNSTCFTLTADMRARMAKVHQRDAQGTLTVTPYETNQHPEFEPGGGGLYSTAQDYLKFMRMILNKGWGNGHQILKPATVERMSQNAMGELRVKKLYTHDAKRSLDTEFFSGVAKTWGLSFMINEDQAPTGRSKGSLAWAGLANTYFWIDPSKNIAGLILMQVLPFADTQAMQLFTDFETAVYEALPS